jgi:hypothetical protein
MSILVYMSSSRKAGIRISVWLHTSGFLLSQRGSRFQSGCIPLDSCFRRNDYEYPSVYVILAKAGIQISVWLHTSGFLLSQE